MSKVLLFFDLNQQLSSIQIQGEFTSCPHLVDQSACIVFFQLDRVLSLSKKIRENYE